MPSCEAEQLSNGKPENGKAGMDTMITLDTKDALHPKHQILHAAHDYIDSSGADPSPLRLLWSRGLYYYIANIIYYNIMYYIVHFRFIMA